MVLAEFDVGVGVGVGIGIGIASVTAFGHPEHVRTRSENVNFYREKNKWIRACSTKMVGHHLVRTNHIIVFNSWN